MALLADDIYARLRKQLTTEAAVTGKPVPLQQEYGLVEASTGGAIEELRIRTAAEEQKRQFNERMAMEEAGQRAEATGRLTQLPFQVATTLATTKQAGLWDAFAGKPDFTPKYAGMGTTPGLPATQTVAMAEGGEQTIPIATTTGAGTTATGAAPGFFAEAGGMTTVGVAGLVGGVAGVYGPGGEKLPGTFGGEKERATESGMIKGAGAGALAGAALTSWSGPGAIVGTVVGAIAGGLSAWLKGKKGGKGGTVICSELYRQGIVSKELLDLEDQYHRNFTWAVYWGYRHWADPVVVLMQRSKLVTQLIAVFGKAFLKEVAHQVDPSRKGSWLGAWLLKHGVPMCEALFWSTVKRYRKMHMWYQEQLEKVGEYNGRY